MAPSKTSPMSLQYRAKQFPAMLGQHTDLFCLHGARARRTEDMGRGFSAMLPPPYQKQRNMHRSRQLSAGQGNLRLVIQSQAGISTWIKEVDGR